MLTGKDIRQKFIQYFQENKHTHVASSSLIPYNDPTLLFTNAGMNQFKDVFLGLETKPYHRAVTSQKCVRAGGKHNDLETVGKTARHHTFFEMLGNFSIGDYFKEDAIKFAWEFLTKELKLPEEKLYITVYKDDDEAYKLWQDLTGFPNEKILRLGEKDNFWQMGDTGPCGPCSEIHYDRGESYACDCEDGCKLGVCDCDRWLEIWNLVFMQFNRDEQGVLHPLPKPNIDTGMGLERITSILQNVDNNFETDLFMPLIRYCEELTSQPYEKGAQGFPFRVIADHARACTFLIADGVMPSNEGRGYVLRRILRRAVRLGKTVGLNEPFLYKFSAKIADIMGEDYPEVVEKLSFIQSVIKAEEERFYQTLQDGLRKVSQTIESLKENGKMEIDGESAFLFYDTYGFPIDLTKDIAEENAMTVDLIGFDQAMEKQRQMSKSARANFDVKALANIVKENFPSEKATEFIGYEKLNAEVKLEGIIVEKNIREKVYDDYAYILLDKTPFYAQGGGQVGDKGKLYGKNGVFNVENTIKLPNGCYLHEGYSDGGLVCGEILNAEVDGNLRKATERNHTATHLLHHALREVLGDHVHQAGSLVSPNYLRFDFSHSKALTTGELEKIEHMVNEMVLSSYPVEASENSIDVAREKGFIALFGEKYGDKVRCLNIGGVSKELCGGTHVQHSSEIGSFKIIGESSVSAGIRRIEALTGEAAYKYAKSKIELLAEVVNALKVTNDKDILDKIIQEANQIKTLKKELDSLKTKMTQAMVSEEVSSAVEDVNGVKVLAKVVQANDIEELRQIADQFKDKMKETVIVLGAVTATDEVILVGMLTPDAVKNKLHVGKVIKEVAKIVDGNGGGRPDMAQAGGKNSKALPQAIASTVGIVEALLT